MKIFNTRRVVAQERRFRAVPGAIASFEVNIGDSDIFPGDRLGRRTLRAEIVGISPPSDPDQPPPEPEKYAATLEVYSLITGHTNILIGGRDHCGRSAGSCREGCLLIPSGSRLELTRSAQTRRRRPLCGCDLRLGRASIPSRGYLRPEALGRHRAVPFSNATREQCGAAHHLD